MNYQKIYDAIIEKAKLENRKKGNGIYYENHHIVPKCCGGNDEDSNKVLLTAKEHFVCHKILLKIYPDNGKLYYALHRMMYTCNNDLSFSSRDYEFIRLYLSKEKHSRYGKKHSEESKQKMRKAHKPYSEEYKQQLREHRKGEKNPMYGKTQSEESKKKIGEKNKNRKHSEESKRKMSESRKGRKRGPYSGPSKLKNKTYEDIFGIERAKEIKNKHKKPKSLSHKENIRLAGKRRRWVYNTIDFTFFSIQVDLLDNFLEKNPHYSRGRGPRQKNRES